jgi:hypothetical protein
VRLRGLRRGHHSFHSREQVRYRIVLSPLVTRSACFQSCPAVPVQSPKSLHISIKVIFWIRVGYSTPHQSSTLLLDMVWRQCRGDSQIPGLIPF